MVIRKRGIRSDEDVVFDSHAIPELNSAFYSDAITDLHTTFDEGVIADVAVRADPGPFDDVRKGPNPCARADVIGLDYGFRMREERWRPCLCFRNSGRTVRCTHGCLPCGRSSS